MQMLTRMMVPPPPTPWMARLAINMLMLTLEALSREPTQNTPTRDQQNWLPSQDGTRSYPTRGGGVIRKEQ